MFLARSISFHEKDYPRIACKIKGVACHLDRICYIAPQKNYVNLGFFFGANLPDPQHFLVGEGKRMRHIKVRSREDAGNPALEQLMKEAWKDAPGSIAHLYKKQDRTA